jgi:hypothetical protein
VPQRGADNYRGSLRGYGAVRAGAGLLVSSYRIAHGAASREPAGDNVAGIPLMKQAVKLGETFNDAAVTHQSRQPTRNTYNSNAACCGCRRQASGTVACRGQRESRKSVDETCHTEQTGEIDRFGRWRRARRRARKAAAKGQAAKVPRPDENPNTKRREVLENSGGAISKGPFEYNIHTVPSDLVEDSRGVYGYLPVEGSQFAPPKWPVDWTNAEQVAAAREVRLGYHQGLADEVE